MTPKPKAASLPVGSSSGDRAGFASAQIVLELASAYPECDASRLREALKRYRSASLNVLVFGEFKRGKSSFVNALLGRKLLPVGVVPLTSLPTVLRYGEDEHVVIETRAGRERHALSDLADFATEARNPNNVRGVLRVEVWVRSAFLREGLCLVDTPGFGSVHAQNTEEARSSLPSADAAVMVLGAQPPLGESERDFLRTARDFASKLVLIQNKADLLPPEDFAEALAYNRRVASTELGYEDVPIIPVSAKHGLLGKTTGDAEARRIGNLEEAEAAIRSLASERGTLLARSVSRAACRAADALTLRVELEAGAAKLDDDEFERRVRLFQDELARLRAAKSESLWGVTGVARTRVVERLDEDLEAFKQREHARLAAIVEQSLESSAGPSEAAAAASKALSNEITRAIQEWAASETENLRAETDAKVAPTRVELSRLRSDLVEPASRLFEVRLPVDELRANLSNQSRFYFHPWEFRIEATPWQSLGARLLGKRWAIQSVRRVALRTAWTQLEMHAGRLRYDFVTRLDDSLRRYRTELDEAFESTTRALAEGLEAAQQGRLATEAERSEAERRRTEFLQRLAAARAQLTP